MHPLAHGLTHSLARAFICLFINSLIIHLFPVGSFLSLFISLFVHFLDLYLSSTCIICIFSAHVRRHYRLQHAESPFRTGKDQSSRGNKSISSAGVSPQTHHGDPKCQKVVGGATWNTDMSRSLCYFVYSSSWQSCSKGNSLCLFTRINESIY